MIDVVLARTAAAFTFTQQLAPREFKDVSLGIRCNVALLDRHQQRVSSSPTADAGR